jgi:hypothetical protein
MDPIVFMVLPGHHQPPVKGVHLPLEPIPMMGLPQDILWSKMAGDTMEVHKSYMWPNQSIQHSINSILWIGEL